MFSTYKVIKLPFPLTAPLWKTGNIIPKYKGKGSRSLPESYRPIIITCSLSRIFERVLYARLLENINRIYSACQHGFRKGKSTTTNHLETYNTIQAMLDSGKPADIIFFDFSKVFDRVPHEILFDKFKTLQLPQFSILLLTMLVEELSM